jgi:hypothetical protein
LHTVGWAEHLRAIVRSYERYPPCDAVKLRLEDEAPDWEAATIRGFLIFLSGW